MLPACEGVTVVFVILYLGVGRLSVLVIVYSWAGRSPGGRSNTSTVGTRRGSTPENEGRGWAVRESPCMAFARRSGTGAGPGPTFRARLRMALAHRIGDATEQAYARDDLFDKRRKLMDAWGKFCAAPSAGDAVVTPLRSA
jgi:hypothetical protein